APGPLALDRDAMVISHLLTEAGLLHVPAGNTKPNTSRMKCTCIFHRIHREATSGQPRSSAGETQISEWRPSALLIRIDHLAPGAFFTLVEPAYRSPRYGSQF